MKTIALVCGVIVSIFFGASLNAQTMAEDYGNTLSDLHILAKNGFVLADSRDEAHHAKQLSDISRRAFERGYAIRATSRLVPDNPHHAQSERNYPSCRE